MADEKLDYEALTNEIGGEELTPERMVGMRKELEGVEFADRNADHTFVWNELAERAQKMIDELSATSLDDAPADRLDALKSLVNEFSSHIQDQYSGTAATLMDKINKRYEVLNAEQESAAKADDREETPETPATEEEKETEKPIATEEKEENTAAGDTATGGNPPEVSEKDAETEELDEIEFLEGMRTTVLRDNAAELDQYAKDNYEGKSFSELTVDETKDAIKGFLDAKGHNVEEMRGIWDEMTPEQRADGEYVIAAMNREPEENNDVPEEEIIDDKDAAFLESITDENKEEIIDRYNRLDEVARELGDVFAKDENGNYTYSGEGYNFQGLESFFDNVYIDADIPENPDEKPSEELRNKRDWLKDETRELALNLALKDLLQDGSIDEITDKEKLKQRLAEEVHDNMTFLTYGLVSTQAGFEALSESKNLDKMLPKDRQEFLSVMRDKSNNATRTVAAILSGTEKTAVKLTTPGITSTFAPYHLETKSFAKSLKEKTGIGKLWNRVQAFDDRMTKAHPILWGFAKSSAVSAAFGPVGIAAMVGHSTYKQFKMLNKEYKKQKAENGGEMKLWDFVKQNPGKVISATVGVVSTCLAAGTGLEAALGGNFGAVANVTGAMLSGDAPQAVSQISSISFNHIVESGKNLVQSVSEQGIDLQGVADGIRNSWTPMRTLRTAMNLGAGFAKASEAYMKAEDGNKWSAAKKVFVGTVTGLVAGNALADLSAVASQEFQQNQAYDQMKQEIEASEKAFQQELENADFSDIKIPLPPDYTVEGGDIPEVTVTGHAHHHETPNQTIPLREVQGVGVATVNTEIQAPDIEVKQVFDVNGEQVAVSQGETLEQTLDNAREEYLNQHPEIDDADNKVKIEGQGVKATIKTEKDDIMASDGEGVIGQETEIDRKIEVGEVKINDHIEKTVTDTGKVEMQESTGRVDYNSQNNIPDGAKVTGTYHFENDNQKLDITAYEADGKTYVTDGNSTRELPEGQSIEKMYKTANAMLKETAEVSYQEAQRQPAVNEAEVKVAADRTGPAPAANETEVKGDAQPAPAANETEVKVTADRTGPAPTAGGSYDTPDGNPPTATADVRDGTQPAEAAFVPGQPTTTQSGLTYSISESGHLSTQAHMGGIHADGVLSGRYVEHLLPEEYKHPSGSMSSEQIDAAKMQIQGLILHHEVYNDLQAQSETRGLTEAEKNFMTVHEKQMEARGLVSREDGVMEYKNTPKDQYYQLTTEPQAQEQEQQGTITVSDKHVQPTSRAFDYGGELEILQNPTVEVVNEGWGFGDSVIHHAGENAPKVDLGFGELTPVAEKVNDNMNTTTQVFLDAEGHRFDKVIDNSDGSYEILDGHSNQTGISGNIKDDKFKLDFTEEGLKVSPNDPQQDAKLAAQERAEDLANKVDEEKTMTDAEKINQLRQGKSLESAPKEEEPEVREPAVKGKAKEIDGDINIDVNSEELSAGAQGFANQARASMDASVADSTGSFTSSVAAASDEFSDFTSSAMDEFNNFTSSGLDEFGSFTNSATDEFGSFTNSATDEFGSFTNSAVNDFNNTVAANQEDFNNTVAANRASYDQSTVDGIVAAGGHDYSAELKGMGLNNAQILSASAGISSKEVTVEGTTTTTHITYQSEFRQGNNGFAMVNNDQVRTVTVEGKNLHFQISENGHVRDMTANEAQQFCNDVKATGAKTEGFNNKLFNSVEGIKHVNDSRGISSYAPEPRGNSGGNVNIQTMQQTMGGGRKI